MIRLKLLILLVLYVESNMFAQVSIINIVNDRNHRLPFNAVNNPIQRPGWILLSDYSDEFDDNSFDNSKWGKANNGFGWDENLKDYRCPYYFTNNNENFEESYNPSIGSGTLKLKALYKPGYYQCEHRDHSPTIWTKHYDYTGASIQSYHNPNGDVLYGYFEIRFKLSDLYTNSNYAFWLYGDNDDEIDIFEILERLCFGGNYHYHNDIDQAFSVYLQSPDFSETFYTAAVEWNPGELIYYLNNVPVIQRKSPNVPSSRCNLIMNVGVADFSKTPDLGVFEIDYVRSYQKDPNYSSNINLVNPSFMALKNGFNSGIGKSFSLKTIPNKIPGSNYDYKQGFQISHSTTNNSNKRDVNGPDGADAEYFLSIQDNTKYNFSLCDQLTNFDTLFEIFNENGSSTGYFNDDSNCSANGLFSIINGPDLYPGNYITVIDGYSGSTGNFKLTIDPTTLLKTNSIAKSIKKNGNLRLKYYPNPFINNLIIENLNDHSINANLYDGRGKSIAIYKISHGINELDLSYLSSGIYFIKFNIDSEFHTDKIIKY